MQMFVTKGVSPQGTIRRFGQSPVLPGALIVGYLLIVFFMLFAPDMPIRFRTWAIPFALIGLAFLVWRFGRRMAACLRPTNWTLALTEAGVCLRLTPYLDCNGDYGEGGDTLRIPYAEIASAQHTVVKPTKRQVEGGQWYKLPWLDLALTHGQTDELAQCIGEIEKATTYASSIPFPPHRPVQVPRPGVVRVEWIHRRMLTTLQGRVPVRPGKHVETGAD